MQAIRALTSRICRKICIPLLYLRTHTSLPYSYFPLTGSKTALPPSPELSHYSGRHLTKLPNRRPRSPNTRAAASSWLCSQQPTVLPKLPSRPNAKQNRLLPFPCVPSVPSPPPSPKPSYTVHWYQAQPSDQGRLGGLAISLTEVSK